MRQYASLCERDLRESPVLSNMGPRYFDATGTQDGDTRNLAKCNTLVHISKITSLSADNRLLW